jgi:hypothetical protein
MIQYTVAGVNLMKFYQFAEYCAVLIEIYGGFVDTFYLWDGKTLILIYFEVLKSWT